MSGAGYGLLVALSLVFIAGLAPREQLFAVVALGFGFTFVSTGLLSSTLHLKHPERAWRALSQWRSSWLSREGVVSIATFGPLLLWAYGWIVLDSQEGWVKAAALGTAILSLITVNCTAMIYASLKSIDAWSQPLVPPGYFAFAAQLGTVWLAVLLAVFGEPHTAALMIAIALSIAVWMLKRRYWHTIDTSPPRTTANTATGLTGTVSAFSAPHTEENFLTHEMGFKVARKHCATLRQLAQGFGLLGTIFFAVVALVLPGPMAIAATVLAALSAMTGAFVERWLFFAEAKHTMAVYYG